MDLVRPSKRILIIAGEASGDLHAANLVQQVRAHNPNIEFIGMGGARMRDAGVDVRVDIDGMAVIGLFDVFAKLPKIVCAWRVLSRILCNEKPDLLILVDYPGFNMPFAARAKKRGIKVLYYIAPQLWASRPGRIKKIKKNVDQLAVIFPFEVDYFQKSGVPTKYVGHPLAQKCVADISVADTKQKFGLQPHKRVIGLFPGSRDGEITRILPVILQSAKLLQQQFPGVEFVLPLASTLSADFVESYISDSGLEIKTVSDKIYNVIQVCDAIIAVSGTVTLEIAMMAVPLVVVYKINPAWFPIQLMVTIPYLGLCNIVAEKSVAKEFWQKSATADNIAHEIAHILSDDVYRHKMHEELLAVRAKIEAKADIELFELIDNLINTSAL